MEHHKEKTENGEEIFERMTKNISKLVTDTKTMVPKISENTEQDEYQKKCTHRYIIIWKKQKQKQKPKPKGVSWKKLEWGGIILVVEEYKNYTVRLSSETKHEENVVKYFKCWKEK